MKSRQSELNSSVDQHHPYFESTESTQQHYTAYGSLQHTKREKHVQSAEVLKLKEFAKTVDKLQKSSKMDMRIQTAYCNA